MAPVKLPCPVGDCNHETIQLEYAQAKEQLDIHVKYTHAAVGGESSKKPDKFPRPEIKLDSSSEDWYEFQVTWEQYKEEYGLQGQSLIRQLYACCSDEMKTSLSRITAGQQFKKDEVELLNLIKQLAVRYMNPAVHVQEFLQQVQQPEEGVRHFLTRLRGIAARCDFHEKCECQKEVSYADSIIRFKLIAGLHDPEIKEDILSENDKTLEETVKAIEAKESGKLARRTVGVPASSKVSEQSTGTKPRIIQLPDPMLGVYNNPIVFSSKCKYCGLKGHMQSKESREKYCPAWDKNCLACDKKGHFRAVCKMKKKQVDNKEIIENDDNELRADQDARIYGLEIGELAALRFCIDNVNKELRKANSVKLDHMIHDQLQWIVSRPPLAPNIQVSVRVDTKSYYDNNIRPPSAFRHREAEILGLADTGAQVVTMGPNQLSRLGLTKNDLLQVEMNLRGANGSRLNIHGAIFILISAKNKSTGVVYKSKQLCYICDGVDKIILSKQTCEQLQMISSKFPEVGISDRNVNQVAPVVDDEQFDLEPCSPDENGSCSCPRRESVPPRPKFDPSLSTSELRKRIIKHYGASAFNRCTRQTLPLMRGEPLPIPTKNDMKPVAVHTPVAIPLHWEDKVYRDLMRDVALGVIEPVPINTPVTWCSRMVVVPKHSGEPRRTVDLQALNRASVRQTHHTRSPFMLASAVPPGTIKSVLDVWNSFHSVPLKMEDRDKTTFITPWGRFRYRVAPQGYLASMDAYTHRFSLITEGIKNKQVIVDDTLLYSMTTEENFNDVCQLLEVGHKAGLIFNSDKFQFGQETVDFAGLEVSKEGVKPSRKLLDSIKNFPRPETLSEARSFFGLVNQVSYTFSMSSVMEPLRLLLKPDTWTPSYNFSWTPNLEESFKLAKQEIVKSICNGVKYFDVKRWTCLATDWSKQGVGFFLMQKWCDCTKLHPKCCTEGWKLVLAGGRFTKPAESRYSPVEGELLAVVEGLNKSKHFILGCDKLMVSVDHKPLLGLLNDKSLAEIDNPRLLMLKEKTLWYNFDVVWVPGRVNSGPDCMSRLAANFGDTTKQARMNCILGFAKSNSEPSCDDIQVSEVDIIDSVVASLSIVEAVTFEKIRVEVQKDDEMLQLVDAITNLSDLDNFPDNLSVYNKFRDNLFVVDGVPMYGRRAIIPKSLRQQILECLHSAHQCPVRMQDRAKQSVYWPGISNDIEMTRASCTYCTRNAPSLPPMPPLPLASPEYPMQMLVGDYFEAKGKTWLVLADRFTGWLSLFYFSKEASATDLIKIMKDYFSVFGICDQFSSDAGPQFKSSQFQSFLKTWGVEHRVSSSYHPKSNLKAETSVKSAKRIVMDNTKLDGSPEWDKIIRATMQHRNTPDTEFGLSPSQLLFGRPIRDFLPIRPGQFSPSEVWIDCKEKRELALTKRVVRGAEKWSEHSRDLPPLTIGSKVLVQNQYGAGKISKKWDKSGMVIEDLGFNKYRIRIDGSGRITDRNRQFLRKFTPFTPTLPGPSQNHPPVAPTPPRESVNQPSVPPRAPVVSEPSEPVSLPVPSSPAPSSPPLPSSPPSPTFVTPPSSPVAPDIPSTSPDPPSAPVEPPFQPRRSTRVRIPTKRYNPAEYDLRQ